MSFPYLELNCQVYPDYSAKDIIITPDIADINVMVDIAVTDMDQTGKDELNGFIKVNHLQRINLLKMIQSK